MTMTRSVMAMLTVLTVFLGGGCAMDEGGASAIITAALGEVRGGESAVRDGLAAFRSGQHEAGVQRMRDGLAAMGDALEQMRSGMAAMGGMGCMDQMDAAMSQMTASGETMAAACDALEDADPANDAAAIDALESGLGRMHEGADGMEAGLASAGTMM